MANPEHVEILQRSVEEWNRLVADTPDVIRNLSGANLSGADLSGANLSGADVSDVDLTGANLKEADLSGSFLRETDFSGADMSEINLVRTDLSHTALREANLSGACLIEAILMDTDLSGANLSEADLSGASLNSVDLSKADLSRANLSRAILGYVDFSHADLSYAVAGLTIFADNDLRTARGLDSVRHLRPSTIGIDTLHRSGGNIPEVFLRGCGVSDNFITFARSLFGAAVESGSCFISYSCEDASFAHRLHDQLQARGIRCWLNDYQTPTVEALYAYADKGPRVRDKVLLCASQSSLTSWWVDNEIDAAIEKERHLLEDYGLKTLALIPLDLDHHLLTGEWESEKIEQIRLRPAVDFAGWERSGAKFERQLELVVKALRADDGSR